MGPIITIRCIFIMLFVLLAFVGLVNGEKVDGDCNIHTQTAIGDDYNCISGNGTIVSGANVTYNEVSNQTYIDVDNGTLNYGYLTYLFNTSITNYTVGSNGSLILGGQYIWENMTFVNSTLNQSGVYNSTIVNTTIVLGNTTVSAGDTFLNLTTIEDGDNVTVNCGNVSISSPIDVWSLSLIHI